MAWLKPKNAPKHAELILLKRFRLVLFIEARLSREPGAGSWALKR
jgi:hypothetical protein